MTRLGLFMLVSLVAVLALGQEDAAIKPVPILTGSTAYFTSVEGGSFQNVPSVTPLLLAPLGNKWLIEAKGSYANSFSNGATSEYGSSSSYGLAYAQLDYIANSFLTITAGRFLTPFGIYNERLTPNWIRALPVTPLTLPVTSDSALGGMLRGGLPAGKNANLNYAVYYSTANTNHIVATDRSTGGRIGVFLPGPRLEIGASFQRVLQGGRSHAVGIHAEWQPNKAPLTLRSEYVRSSGLNGSGYWIESVYRLSQISRLRRFELVGRAQQFFADPKLTPDQAANLDDLGHNTNQGDFGLNYYLRSDVRATASYGREFALGQNVNIWVVGITYRFLVPLGPKGGAL